LSEESTEKTRRFKRGCKIESIFRMDQMPRSKFCARGPGIFPPLPDSMEFPDPFGWWVRRSVCSIALLLVCLDCASDSSSYRALLPFDSKVATLPLNLQSLSPDKYIHLLKFAPEPWARGVKSFIIAFPMSGSLTLLKVDTTSAFQHSKRNRILR
jgi:hypothetical protein